MKQAIFFLIIMFLPGWIFGQVNFDSIWRAPSNSPTLIYSASYSIVDSATAAQNRMALYQQQKVKRDTAKAITISRDSIWQDNTIAGYFIFSGGACYIYNPNGFLIATAGSDGNKKWGIQSQSDRKIHSLISAGFFEEDIAQYLIKQGYL